MADKRYRLMSLAQRGLYITLLNECWVNRSVPSSKEELGKMLGIRFDEIVESLTPAVLSFFELHGDELICPELEGYRVKLEERREKMSSGGRKGAQTKWSTGTDGVAIEHPNGGAMGTRVEKGRREVNRGERIRGESTERGVVDADFVAAYDYADRQKVRID